MASITKRYLVNIPQAQIEDNWDVSGVSFAAVNAVTFRDITIDDTKIDESGFDAFLELKYGLTVDTRTAVGTETQMLQDSAGDLWGLGVDTSGTLSVTKRT